MHRDRQTVTPIRRAFSQSRAEARKLARNRYAIIANSNILRKAPS